MKLTFSRLPQVILLTNFSRLYWLQNSLGYTAYKIL